MLSVTFQGSVNTLNKEQGLKFARTCDVAAVLSNRQKVSKDHPNVFIKPFMSTAERKIESILLKERRTLIGSGVERKPIKIRGNSIYINKTKVGSANEDIFIRWQDQSSEPTPTRHGTNIVLSATAASNAANTTNYVSSTSTTDEHNQRTQTIGRPHSSSPLSTNSN
jgi:hypothetical protein